MTSFTIPWKDAKEDLSKTILTIVQLVYGVPSISLMIFLLIYMGCSQKYASSFYRLVQVDLLTNTLCFLNTWISLRSSEFPFGNVYTRFLLSYIPWLWNLSCLMLNFFFHMQFWSAASLSIHRISSLLFFNSYEKFWSRYYLLVQIMFFIYSCIPQIIVTGHAPQMNLVNGSLYYTYDPVGTSNLIFQNYFLTVTYFVVLVGLSISVPLIAMKKFEGAIANSNVAKKLTKIALTYGIVYSGILCWQIVNAVQDQFAIFPKGFGAISYSLLSVASDMMTLALPYILIIFDSNIRRDLGPSRETSTTNPLVIST